MLDKKENYNNPVYGKLYYDTGELKYEGYYSPAEHSAHYHEPNGRGIYYYKNCVVYREGQFQHGGLFEGKEYYPSGMLKFDGRYNCRKTDGGYYGPTYPVSGRFYDEHGVLIYEGEFKIERQGSIRYPKVILPEGFGLANQYIGRMDAEMALFNQNVEGEKNYRASPQGVRKDDFRRGRARGGPDDGRPEVL